MAKRSVVVGLYIGPYNKYWHETHMPSV